eukprot:1363137-Amorphochlora_amoeboformis.AAC.1
MADQKTTHPPLSHRCKDASECSPMEEEYPLASGSGMKRDKIARNFSTPPADRNQQIKSAVSSQFVEARAPHRPSGNNQSGGPITAIKKPSRANLKSSMPEQILDVIHFLDCVEERLEHMEPQGPMSSFHSVCRPSISIKDYVYRIAQYARCSPQCFVLAVIYIDRMRSEETVEINTLTIHRLAITAIVVASKFLDDRYHSNATFAKIGGTTGSELNVLELEFVFRLRFELYVSSECFEAYSQHISNFRASREL